MAEGRWLDDTGLERPRDAVPTPRSDRLGQAFLWIGGVWLVLTLALGSWWGLSGLAVLAAIWGVSLYLETEAVHRSARSHPH